jgi:hypothetical protein
MPAEKDVLILLRRDPRSLTRLQQEQLAQAFPRGYELVRTDPRTHLEHFQDCLRMRPQAVIVPDEKQILSTAVRENITHIIAGRKLGLLELITVDPTFRVFPL